MNQTKRPILLSGLILSVIALGISAIVMLMSVFVVGALVSAMVETGFIEPEIASLVSTVATIILIVFVVLAVVALILAAVSIPRCKLAPQEFEGKKGIVIASCVFGVILSIVMIASLISSFAVLNFMTTIALVAGVVLTIVGICQNKKLLQQQTPVEDQVQ